MSVAAEADAAGLNMAEQQTCMNRVHTNECLQLLKAASFKLWLIEKLRKYIIIV